MTPTMKKILFLLLPLMLIACGGNDGLSEEDAKKVEGQKRIRAMEDSLFDNRAFDQRSAQAMVDVYKAYASAYPQDSLAPEYLFRAAGTMKSMHDPEGSLNMYDRVIKDYPTWNRMVDVLYMKALTLDDDLDRLGEARTAYMQVISNYPDHPFARDARVMIDNLGLSDEELIAKFQAMQQDTTTAEK